MRSKTAWRGLMIIVMMALLLSIIVSISTEDNVRMLFIACSVCFFISLIMIVVTRRKYLELLDRNSTVECFRLKRPGIEKSTSDDAIVPKGKMPGK